EGGQNIGEQRGRRPQPGARQGGHVSGDARGQTDGHQQRSDGRSHQASGKADDGQLVKGAGQQGRHAQLGGRGDGSRRGDGTRQPPEPLQNGPVSPHDGSR